MADEDDDLGEDDPPTIVTMKKILSKHPNLKLLILASKDGIMIRSTAPQDYAKLLTASLIPICDKAKAVVGEFEMKDQIRFFTLRTTDNDFMIHFDPKFFVIGVQKPIPNDIGNPEILGKKKKKKKKKK